MFGRIGRFRKEVWMELKKVSWSTKDEVVTSTAVVIVTVFLLAAFIGIVDFVYAHLLRNFIRILTR